MMSSNTMTPMKRAHELHREAPSRSFGDCLKQAWAEIKAAVRPTAETVDVAETETDTDAADAADVNPGETAPAPAPQTRRSLLRTLLGVAVAAAALPVSGPAQAAAPAAAQAAAAAPAAAERIRTHSYSKLKVFASKQAGIFGVRTSAREVMTDVSSEMGVGHLRDLPFSQLENAQRAIAAWRPKDGTPIDRLCRELEAEQDSVARRDLEKQIMDERAFTLRDMALKVDLMRRAGARRADLEVVFFQHVDRLIAK